MTLADRFRAATGQDLVGLDAGTLERADALARTAPVLWLAEPVPGYLEGDVQGSGKRVYRTTAALAAVAEGLRADIRCSCPIGRQCKHGAALIAHWVEHRPAPASGGPDADDPSRIQQNRQRAMQWVRRLQAIALPAPADTGPAQTVARLHFVLVPARRQCWLRVYPLYRGPGGRLFSRADGNEDTADRPRDIAFLRDAATPASAGWDAIERRVASALAGAHWQPGEGLALDAPHARSVLFELARNGRLYLYHPPRYVDDPPLALADPKAGELVWVDVGGLGAPSSGPASAGPGSAPADAAAAEPPPAGLQLAMAVTGGAGQVLYLAEPAWVNRFDNTIGPLALTAPPALLDWLRDAPVVPHAAATDIATALLAQLRARPGLARSIPALPGTEVAEIHVPPQPVLGLFIASSLARRPGTRASASPPAGKAWLVVSFAVEYAGHRLEPLRLPSLPVQTASGPALVTTDAEAETSLREDLLAHLEDLEDPALTLARDGRSNRTGWLTVATVPADSLAAVRIRHALIPALRDEGWLISDQADMPWRLLDAGAGADGDAGAGAGAGDPGPHPDPNPPRAAGTATGAILDLALQPQREAGGNPSQDWFALQAGLRIGDRRIDLAAVLAGIIAAGSFAAWAAHHVHDGIHWMALGPGQWLRLPVSLIEPLARQLAAWAQPDPASTAARDGSGAATGWRIDGVAAARIAADAGLPLPAPIAGLGRWLHAGDGLPAVEPSPAFTATLRPYQRVGLGWLRILADAGAGGILADDMGLGKTVQVLAHLDAERARGRLQRPALVVAPTSVVSNWAAEAARHAPALRTLRLTGAQRPRDPAIIAGHDLVLTSYALLSRDAELLAGQPWQALVFDEAQWVKNHRTRAWAALRQLQAAHRIGLTGTPLENHLGELWAILDLTTPGLLGSEADFRRRFRLPIERARTAVVEPASRGEDAVAAPDSLADERMHELLQRIRPFVLRRTKADVARDLPPRTEFVQRIELPDSQREHYEMVRATMDRRVRDALARADREGGRARSQGRIVLLDALLKLRQICCDPALVRTGDGGPRRSRSDLPSAKRDALIELLVTLAAERRKTLVFSQFRSMLDLIEQAIDAEPRLAGLQRSRLDGDTVDRDAAIDAFQQGSASLFLLSLKAGGVGLNLTAADTVILYDPWWNPAVERQATDRAHRIGQQQPVFVIKLIAADTIEERILAMQADKSELAEAVLSGSLSGSSALLSRDALLALLG